MVIKCVLCSLLSLLTWAKRAVFTQLQPSLLFCLFLARVPSFLLGSILPSSGSWLLILPERKISSVFAAAAAKSLHLCPTLCDLRDGSPPGSPVPGILQARTLEWVAISFPNAWKWKVKVILSQPTSRKPTTTKNTEHHFKVGKSRSSPLLYRKILCTINKRCYQSSVLSSRTSLDTAVLTQRGRMECWRWHLWIARFVPGISAPCRGDSLLPL